MEDDLRPASHALWLCGGGGLWVEIRSCAWVLLRSPKRSPSLGDLTGRTAWLCNGVVVMRACVHASLGGEVAFEVDQLLTLPPPTHTTTQVRKDGQRHLH